MSEVERGKSGRRMYSGATNHGKMRYASGRCERREHAPYASTHCAQPQSLCLCNHTYCEPDLATYEYGHHSRVGLPPQSLTLA